MATEADAPTGTPVPGLAKSWAAVFHRLRAVRRLGWGVADQVVSSLTNFAVSIYLVHTLGAAAFGAFSLAYLTYGFALNASRGLTTDPLMVRFSGTDLSTWRSAVAICTGAATVVGAVAGTCALVAAILLGGTAGAAFLALGLFMPALMLQDSWRFSFFALGRGSQAFLNDTIWAVVLLPALVFLRETRHTTVFWLVFAWGAAAAVAAGVGLLQARVVPNVPGMWKWLREHRDLGPRYLAEGTVSNAGLQLRGYGLGLMLGLAAVGYVQAAVTLIGPMTVLFAAMGLVIIPEAVRVLRRAPARLRLFCVLVSAGLAAIGGLWGLILLVMLPRGLGAWLLGPIWRPTYPLVLPTMIAVVGGGVSVGGSAGLHALGAARKSLRVALLGSAATLGLTLAGSAKWGAVGALWGNAAAGWASAVLSWWNLRASLRESGIVPADGRLWSIRPRGRYRGIPTSAAALLPAAPKADTFTPSHSLPPSPDGELTLRRAARHTQPRRSKISAPAAKALLAAVVIVLVAAGGASWMLVHGSTGARRVADPQAPAAAIAHRPVAARASDGAPSDGADAYPLKPVSAGSFNPYGNGQDENSKLAPSAIDDNSATAWRTAWYASARFGNLKPGTGLLLDMGRAVLITRVRLLLGSARGADLQVRIGTATTSLSDLQPMAYATDAGGPVDLRLTKPTRGRYVVIWFTKLPPDTSGTFQATVYNVSIEGRT